VGPVVAEMRWRQPSPARDIRDAARDITILEGMPIGDISQSIAGHAFLVLRVSTLPSRAVTQTLLTSRPRIGEVKERGRTEQLKDYGCPNVVCLEFAAPMSHATSLWIRLFTDFS